MVFNKADIDSRSILLVVSPLESHEVVLEAYGAENGRCDEGEAKGMPDFQGVVFVCIIPSSESL